MRIEKGKILKRYFFDAPYNESSFACAGSFFEVDNHLWFISFSGHLFSYDEKTDSFQFQELPIELDKINTASLLPDGKVWLGGNKGVFELDFEGKEFKNIHQISDLQ